MNMPAKITYQGLELRLVKGHVASPHYHATGMRCKVCGKQNDGLIKCGTKLTDIAKIECSQCTAPDLDITYVCTTHCYVPLVIPI